MRIQDGLCRAQEKAASPRHSGRPKTAPNAPTTPGRVIEEPAMRPGGAHDPRTPLDWTVDMLAACSSQDLDRLTSLKGSKKCIAVQRWGICFGDGHGDGDDERRTACGTGPFQMQPSGGLLSVLHRLERTV